MAKPCLLGLETFACTRMYGMVLAVTLFCVVSEVATSEFAVKSTADAVTISNRFLRFTLSIQQSDDQGYNFGLVEMASDFAGIGDFDRSPNLLSRPLLCMVHWRSDFLPVPCLPSSNITISQTPSAITVSTSFAAEDPSTKGRIVSRWTLELHSGSRQLLFRTEGHAHRIHGAYLSIDVAPPSITARYQSGSTQMMQQDGWIGYRPSTDPLHHVFFVGPIGAVEIWRQAASRTVCGKATGGDPTFLSSTPLNAGLRELIVGELHGTSLEKMDTWGAFEYASHGMKHCKASFETVWYLSVNNLPFPSSSVPRSKLWHNHGPEYTRVTAAATGIFATVLGTLATHNNSVAHGKHLHAIATGVLHPRRGYAHLFNFFDPDSYLAIQALLLLGDDALNEEIRLVLELSGAHICNSSGHASLEVDADAVADEKLHAPRRPSREPGGEAEDPTPNRNCTPNQLPHHFVKDVPVFTAISGERQTGPNIFWTLTALEFAKSSGNTAWLRRWLPTFRRALAYLEMDADLNLFWADGSLMIDTFVRRGFTSDTNAAVVLLLQELARAEEVVGNADRGAGLREQAARVQKAMNDKMWAGDHYVTSINKRGHSEDFVDYDANLMAAAVGVADEMGGADHEGCARAEAAAVAQAQPQAQPQAQAQAGCPSRAELLLARIDSNPLARRVPGWVSEVLYQGNWTQPRGGTADAVCGMGRIVWFEALARRRVRSEAARAAVERRLDRLQEDVTQMVWMSERYAPDGRIQADRTSHYFEFPAVTALLLHKVWYGISLEFDAVTVDPWDVPSFDWFFGTMQVRYKRAIACEIRVPRHGPVKVIITGMAETEGVEYLVSVACDDAHATEDHSFISRTDANGGLNFSAHLGKCDSELDILHPRRGWSGQFGTDSRYPKISAFRLSAAADSIG